MAMQHGTFVQRQGFNARQHRRLGPRQAMSPLAVAMLMLLGSGWQSAGAVVTVSGNFNVGPVPTAVGPGDTDLLGNTLGLGSSATGDLLVSGGSLLSAASIRFADGGNGVATGLFTGNGTRVNLTGSGNTNRLELGAWGRGSLTVADGATLDGRANSADCLLGARFCHNFVGNAAGSDATLTITGAGSNASFLRAFVVGGLAIFRPPIENFTFGTPGGSTRGAVNVLAGGLLTTDGGQIGVGPGGSSPQGNERSFADVAVSGLNSVWRVTGGTLENTGASLNTAIHRNAWATLTVRDGGRLWIDGRAGFYNSMNLTTGGGRTDALVSGANSQILFTGDAGILQVGRSNGSANLSVLAGGSVNGLFYLSVGRDGSSGDLLIDGAGSVVRVNGTASAAANINSGPAFVDIGRNGTGKVTVSNGGQLLVEASQGLTNGTGMNLGRDAASSGTLNISGAGSVVKFMTTSSVPGGGPGETGNPGVRVGRDGTGVLNISGGGKLLLEGGAISTTADRRSTSFYIGGINDTTVGGRGIATVSGTGSEIRVTGQDTFIGVGIGPQSNGQLSVSNLASVSSMGMNVGRSGGVGVLKVDNATLNFSGQQSAGNLAGGFLAIGNGGGIGVAQIGNGSVVNLNNLGSSGAGVSLGGTGGVATAFPGGDGSLTLSGGSRINVVAGPGLAGATVGREGSGFLRMSGASSLNIGDGVMTIARNSGSDGTVIASEGSSITAGWLGVGARKTDTGNVDGGTGTFVLINSTLTAPEIVVGTNGFLGGSGTIVGNVTNRGIFAPGNSPGTMEITGSFVAEAGSRMILEVESDGNNGFKTDQVIFGAGQPVDLTHLKVEFRFLGNTDPLAFRASGGGAAFSVNTFFQQREVGGGTSGLAPESFVTASFSASAADYSIGNFSFTAGSGANQFTATPVPELDSAAMLFAGLATLGWLMRRRRA